MDQAMSAALMADFTGEQIGHKPATWCKGCSAAVRNKTGRSCGEHKAVKCGKCKTTVTEAHACLDFVGHADVRARLCEVDPEWSWAPFEFPGAGSVILSDGQPVGLWITLTVGGVSKPGYGSVDKGKPEAMKELIGDALRNAGLSFGIAWKLWAKGERNGGEGGRADAGAETWDNATPAQARNGNGQQRGQVSRPARTAPAQASDEIDPDAQAFADEAHQARSVAEMEGIHQRAREAGKLTRMVANPASGGKGKLAIYLDWRRKQLKEVDDALSDLSVAAAEAGMSPADLDGFLAEVCATDLESATAAQLREAARRLGETRKANAA